MAKIGADEYSLRVGYTKENNTGCSSLSYFFSKSDIGTQLGPTVDRLHPHSDITILQGHCYNACGFLLKTTVAKSSSISSI